MHSRDRCSRTRAKDCHEFGYAPAVPPEDTISAVFVRHLKKSGLQFTKVMVTDRAGQLLDWLSLAETAWERLRLRF